MRSSKRITTKYIKKEIGCQGIMETRQEEESFPEAEAKQGLPGLHFMVRWG
jgi:hypothetical protein